MKVEGIIKFKELTHNTQITISVNKGYDVNLEELKLLVGKKLRITFAEDKSQIQSWLLNRIWSFATKRMQQEYAQDNNRELKKQIMDGFIQKYCKNTGSDIFHLSTIRQVPAIEFSDWLLGLAMAYDFVPNYPYKLVCNPNILLGASFNSNKCFVCGAEGEHTHHLDARGHSKSKEGWDLDMHIVRLCAFHHRVIEGQDVDRGDVKGFKAHENGKLYNEIYKLDNLKELLTKRELKNMEVKV